MFQTNNNLIKNKELSPFCKKLLKEILPDLKKIDSSKLSEKSKIAINGKNNTSILNIEIKAKDTHIPDLYIDASEDHCFLGLFDHEEVEYYGNTNLKADELIKTIKTILKKYLSGITIIEYYNKKGGILKKDYYYGLTSKLKEENKVGNSIYYRNFFQKTHSQRKIQHTFF